MSKVVTPSVAQSATSTCSVSHEKIAMRAYEKWCKRGRPHGTELVDWLEAEAELRAESSRSGSGAPSRR